MNDLGKITTWHVDGLRPRPSYIKHGLAVSVDKLSALVGLGELAFQEPIVITQDGTIVDGYARVELARLQDRLTLPCIQHTLTEDEALQWLLQRHRRSDGMNAFSRILLALKLNLHSKSEREGTNALVANTRVRQI